LTRHAGHLDPGARAAALFDANADGLVGPTHNYAGLSLGNVASLKNKGLTANPREAALQGLAKMRLLMQWGVPQMVLPPLLRPRFDVLHALGFRGSRAAMLQAAAKADPALLASVYSASSMWAANAATITPGNENVTGIAQVTPANLTTTWHRSLEAQETAYLLRIALPAKAGFNHHAPLPSHARFSDEGAANHTRLCPSPEAMGLHLFAYGRADGLVDGRPSSLFPSRQSLAASQAIARRHGLPDERVLFLQQSPEAIAAGVFHNDVIAVGQNTLWLVHEQAYVGGMQAVDQVVTRIRRLFGASISRGGGDAFKQAAGFKVLKVTRRQLPLSEAVASYLFNSQIVSTPAGENILVCAQECRESPKAWRVVQGWIDQGAFTRVEVADLRQSMRNGGGPACLRLRLTLNSRQWSGVPAGLRLNSERLAALEAWVKTFYRDRLAPRDLLDPGLADEVATALEELTKVVRLPRLYRAVGAFEDLVG
jgi:succinylarginine dihydrolase